MDLNKVLFKINCLIEDKLLIMRKKEPQSINVHIDPKDVGLNVPLREARKIVNGLHLYFVTGVYSDKENRLRLEIHPSVIRILGMLKRGRTLEECAEYTKHKHYRQKIENGVV